MTVCVNLNLSVWNSSNATLKQIRKITVCTNGNSICRNSFNLTLNRIRKDTVWAKRNLPVRNSSNLTLNRIRKFTISAHRKPPLQSASSLILVRISLCGLISNHYFFYGRLSGARGERADDVGVWEGKKRFGAVFVLVVGWRFRLLAWNGWGGSVGWRSLEKI